MPGLPVIAPAALQGGALADAGSEGIYLVDRGLIADANPQLAAMLGYDGAELIGRPVLDIVAPASQPAVWRAIRTGATGCLQFHAVRKDTRLLTVEGRSRLLPYRDGVAHVTALRDVTDRWRAASRQRALVAGTAGAAGPHFFRALVKHLARAFDARGAFVAETAPSAPTRLRSLGVWFDTGYADDFEHDLAGTASGDVVSKGLSCIESGAADRFPGDRLLNRWRVRSLVGLPLSDASGATTGILAVADPGSMPVDEGLLATLRVFAARAGVEIERLRADRQVRELNQALEARVAARTRELESANHELEAFSYSVSHDLRAPLRQITGFVELLERDATSGLHATARQHLTDIADSARQMSTLIETLLEFSRVGRAELVRTRVDVTAMVRELTRELSKSAAGRTIEWVVHDLPAVWCDAPLMRQVWWNLLANAVKYTRPRAVARIEVGVLPADGPGDIVYMVRDNGVGFDMRRVGRLFGVFERLHAPSQFEGNGIGLANVQRIVQRHGGRVWAAGEVDRGASFYFAMPARSFERGEAA